MSIWFDKNITIEKLEHFGKGNMAGFLEMKWESIGDNFLKMSMPVNDKTKQVFGLLHGGASCALAETVGSIASALVLDNSKFVCVGLEINANHVRSATDGKVIATASPIHLGKSTHVWDIKIHDEKEKLVCISRLTTAIIPSEQVQFSNSKK